MRPYIKEVKLNIYQKDVEKNDTDTQFTEKHAYF